MVVVVVDVEVVDVAVDVDVVVEVLGAGDVVEVEELEPEPDVSITSLGGRPPSLLTRLRFVAERPVSANEYVPSPWIALVTFTLVHAPAANDPEEPITLPYDGAPFQATDCSFQLDATGRTS